MATIKLVEDYSVTHLRNDVRDSLQMAGEQSILLQLYHAGDRDAEPCSACGDDFYKSPEVRCPSCYGTMFEGGVRVAMLVWSLYTDRPEAEKLANKGQYRPDAREVQMEAFPLVGEHDVVVRVSAWTSAGVPASVYGFYELQTVQQRSLRTGNRFGQSSLDVVAQKAQLTELATDAGITNYPIVGRTFLESMYLSPSAPTVPSQAVIAPDMKTIYYPIAQGGVLKYTTTIGYGVGFPFNFPRTFPTTITIHHGLGSQNVVTSITDSVTAEVITDIDVVNTDPDTVTITFNNPPSADAYSIIVIG